MLLSYRYTWTQSLIKTKNLSVAFFDHWPRISLSQTLQSSSVSRKHREESPARYFSHIGSHSFRSLKRKLSLMLFPAALSLLHAPIWLCNILFLITCSVLTSHSLCFWNRSSQKHSHSLQFCTALHGNRPCIVLLLPDLRNILLSYITEMRWQGDVACKRRREK
jgi:hypothetical protein